MSARRVAFGRWPALVALAVVLPGLAGCGKKPYFVDPPEGTRVEKFPRVYPNPRYDPAPVGAIVTPAPVPAPAPAPADRPKQGAGMPSHPGDSGLSDQAWPGMTRGQ